MNWVESWFDGDSRRGNTFNSTWSDDTRKFSMRGRGEFEFSDDDTDITRVTPGGYLTLEERTGFDRTRLDIVAGANGGLQRTFIRNGQAVSYEPEGRAWLAKKVPDLVRRTGFGAEARVRRIVAKQGPAGVLDEVSKIDSDFVKRLYLSKLIDLRSIDAPTLSRLITQAGREIKSDFELATMLITVAKSQLLTTDDQRVAYVVATQTIQSSFEHRRALEPLVESGPLAEPVQKALFDSAARIESDFELATLLIKVGKHQTLTSGAADAYAAASTTIDSDFELRRALTPLISQGPALSATTQRILFGAASGIQSDFELATLLIELLERHRLDEASREPFFTAVDSLQSDFERGRVLKALAKGGSLTDSIAIAAINSTKRMNSAFEASNALQSVAAAHTLAGPVRQAYVEAAERLQSEHERDRALILLVRSESRAR